MRKPRNFDAELKALGDRAKALKERKVIQLGDLVIAAGADALPAEELAGALLAAAVGDATAKEAWRRRGAAFFQKPAGAGGGAHQDIRGAAPRARASESTGKDAGS